MNFSAYIITQSRQRAIQTLNMSIMLKDLYPKRRNETQKINALHHTLAKTGSLHVADA